MEIDIPALMASVPFVIIFTMFMINWIVEIVDTFKEEDKDTPDKEENEEEK